jgi:hypothetical protein
MGKMPYQPHLETGLAPVSLHRLEAPAAIGNGRGHVAHRELGAAKEAVLRQAVLREGAYLDRTPCGMRRHERYEAKTIWGNRRVH